MALRLNGIQKSVTTSASTTQKDTHAAIQKTFEATGSNGHRAYALSFSGSAVIADKDGFRNLSHSVRVTLRLAEYFTHIGHNTAGNPVGLLVK